jgi:hypothetical protein
MIAVHCCNSLVVMVQEVHYVIFAPRDSAHILLLKISESSLSLVLALSLLVLACFLAKCGICRGLYGIPNAVMLVITSMMVQKELL